MPKFQLHINSVLQDMIARLKTVCPKVYVANRPLASKDENKEFLVLSNPYSVRDRGAFQHTYFRIEIYVKTKAQGVPNMARLESISNAILALFPMSAEDKRYVARKPYLTLQGNDEMGYTVWYLQASLLVNTIDSYKTEN